MLCAACKWCASPSCFSLIRDVFLFTTYLCIMMLNGEIGLCLKSINSDEESDTDLKHC